MISIKGGIKKEIEISKDTIIGLIEAMMFLEAVLDNFVKVQSNSKDLLLFKLDLSFEELTKFEQRINLIISKGESLQKLLESNLELIQEYGIE